MLSIKNIGLPDEPDFVLDKWVISYLLISFILSFEKHNLPPLGNCNNDISFSFKSL
jgi:hypothetical protein